jgi:dynein heavy chain
MKVAEILNQFEDGFSVFGNITYNPLIPEDDRFVRDYNAFMEKVEDLDEKLASIFCQAFDDCFNLESIYKVSCIFTAVEMFY